MATHATKFDVGFDTETYTIHFKGEGSGSLDVYRDLYKAGRTAWLASEKLRRFMFPIRMVGGEHLVGDSYLAVSFFLDDRWQIKVDESLELTVRGNFWHDKGRDPFKGVPHVARLGPNRNLPFE